MVLLFKGTYEELVDRMFCVSESRIDGIFIEVADEPVLRFITDGDKNWEKAVFIESCDDGVMIYPIMNGYEQKLPFAHAAISNVTSSVFVFFAVELPVLVMWLLIFGSHLWFISFAISFVLGMVLRKHLKKKEKHSWTEIYAFFIREIGCQPYGDEKNGFGVYIK